VDISKLIYFPPESGQYPLTFSEPQNHKIDDILDIELIRLSSKALTLGEKVWISKEIKNTDRATGAMLSGKIMKRFEFRGLEDDTINAKFYGSAGQSFGAFLCKGITFHLEGDTNDYLAKGLSGGRIIITPPQGSVFDPSDNIITGNTTLFGATGGELFVRGLRVKDLPFETAVPQR
jgi:glutamate synthase (NADPH) large chain